MEIIAVCSENYTYKKQLLLKQVVYMATTDL
jgi:hypothetical protein